MRPPPPTRHLHRFPFPKARDAYDGSRTDGTIREGREQACAFEFNCAPILADDGRTEGFFIAVTETTHRAVNDRRLQTLYELTSLHRESVSVADACRRAVDILTTNEYEASLALIYLTTGAEARATLAAAAGSALSATSAPEHVTLAADGLGPWPFAEAVAPGKPREAAVAFPLFAMDASAARGFLVIGDSMGSAFDENRRTFFSLAAHHVAATLARTESSEARRQARANGTDVFASSIGNGSMPERIASATQAAAANNTSGVDGDPVELRHDGESPVDTNKDVLDLTRAEQRNQPLTLRALDVQTPLEAAVERVRGDAATKQLRLELELHESGPIVWGDQPRLQQVFWNVLKNAVKFTPEAGRVTVTTETDAARGMVLVKITDTGIGMTAVEQAQLLAPTARGDQAGNGGAPHFGGLGLGLMISHVVIEMHSGKLHGRSAGRDLGSEFVIELPLYHAPDRHSDAGAAWPLTSAALGSPTKPAAVPRVRVLLVEDHAPTRNTLAHLLGRRNYEVLAAGSVAEARGFGDDFELVISDIGLPDGDGYELMAGLRSSRPNLPGIAITGYGMEEDFVRSRAAGFGLHLIKPVDIAALEAAIACVSRPLAGSDGTP